MEDARREIDGVIKELRKLDSQVESLLRTEGSAAFQLLLVERELGEARAAIDSARANLSRLLVEKHNRVKEILSASTTLDVIENDLTNTKLQTLETLIEKILGSVKR